MILFLSTVCGSVDLFAQDDIQSYINPTYKKKKYKKVMVIAPFDPPTYRKRTEKSLVEELKGRGIKAFPSTDILPDEILKDTAEIIKRAKEAGVDGVVVINYLGQSTKVTEQMDYNGSVYYYGLAFATFDLDTRNVKAGLIQLDFYIPDAKGSQYRTGVIVNMTNNSDIILQEFAIKARKKITGDKIL
jgi:ABC-type branched-subunit amino acid transport system substrate-binding protein